MALEQFDALTSASPTVNVDEICSICLEPLWIWPNTGEPGWMNMRLTQLQCGHVFHAVCLEESHIVYTGNTLVSKPAIRACPNCRGTLEESDEYILADFSDQFNIASEDELSDASYETVWNGDEQAVSNSIVLQKPLRQLDTPVFYIDPVSHHAWCPCEDDSKHRWLTSGSLEIYTDPCSHKRWICYAETGHWCWLPTGTYGDTEEF